MDKVKNEIAIQWEGGMTFNADTIGGSIKVDASDVEGLGVRPKALMLTSLAGCSGMDMASLLKKMRAEVDTIEIKVTGELTDEHPKYYDKVHMDYYFGGSELKKDKIEKAVELSVDKYCGVMEMFRKFAEVTTAIHYIEK